MMAFRETCFWVVLQQTSDKYLKGVPQKGKIPKTSTHNLQTSNSISKSLAGYERRELPVPGFKNGRGRLKGFWIYDTRHTSLNLNFETLSAFDARFGTDSGIEI